MAEPTRITDPTLLQRQQATLVLLQPLANAEMLKACRVPNTSQNPQRHEVLDIQPLGKAWRKALMKVPPIKQLTFDLNLPKEDEASKGSFQKLYWHFDVPREGGLGVPMWRVIALIITIANVTRMRTEGDLEFAVTWDGTDEWTRGAIACLKDKLFAVAKFKVPAVKDREKLLALPDRPRHQSERSGAAFRNRNFREWFSSMEDR